MRLNFTQQKNLHKTLATLADHWNDQTLPESLREFALSQGPHNLMMAGELEKAIGVLTEYAVANERLKVFGSDNWVDDIAIAFSVDDAKKSLHIETKQKLKVWNRFCSQKAHILRRGDSDWTANKILLQLAFEHAETSPIRQAAEQWFDLGHCDWLWVKSNQISESIVFDPHVSSFEHQSHTIVGMKKITENRFVSWSKEGEVAIWQDGKAIILQGKHFWKVQGVVSVSPTRLASWSSSELILWDIDSNELILHSLQHTQPIKEIISIDSDHFISWGNENAFFIWSAQKGCLVNQLSGHTAAISKVVVFPDETILSAAEDGFLKQWSKAKPQSLKSLDCKEGIDGFVVSQNSPRIYCWAYSALLACDIHTAEIISINAGQDVGLDYDSIKGTRRCILGVRELREGQWLATWAEGGGESLKLWDANSLELVCSVFLSDGDYARDVQEFPGNYQIKQDELHWEFRDENDDKKISTSLMMIRGKDYIYLMYLPDLITLERPFRPRPKRPNFPLVGHSRQRIITDSLILNANAVVSFTPHEAIIWHKAPDKEQFKPFVFVTGSAENEIKGVIRLSDDRCVTWGESGKADIWDFADIPASLPKPEYIRTAYYAEIDTGKIESAAVLDDGRLLILKNNNDLIVQDVVTGEILKKYRLDRYHLNSVENAKQFADGQFVWLPKAKEYSGQIWNLSTGEQLGSLKTEAGFGFCPYILNKNTIILYEGREKLVCWRIPEMEVVWDVPLNEDDSVRGLQKIDSDRFVYWQQDAKIHVLDINDGHFIHILDHWQTKELQELALRFDRREKGIRKKRWVFEVSISSNGGLLTITADGSIYSWSADLSKYSLLADIEANQGCNSMLRVIDEDIFLSVCNRGDDIGKIAVWSKHCQKIINYIETHKNEYLGGLIIIDQYHILSWSDDHMAVTELMSGKVIWEHWGWSDEPKKEFYIFPSSLVEHSSQFAVVNITPFKLTEFAMAIWETDSAEIKPIGSYGRFVVILRDEKLEILEMGYKNKLLSVIAS
jgi:hypothetical protein